MEQPRVSIAMCTYEGAPFVSEQLWSLFAQTRLPDEIVVSDDGSSDGTLEIVSALAKEAPVPVRVEQNRSPVGYRRNFERAIGSCTGDIVFLADQDDVWLPHKIEAMLPFFSVEGVGIVHCDAILTDVKLMPRGGTVFTRQSRLGIDRPRTPLELVRGVGVPGCTMGFRRGLTEALFPVSELWGHDLWIALVGGALAEIAPISRPMMLYRRHGRSAGPSRQFDAGPVDRVKDGVRARRLDWYERDREKWREVVERIEGVVRDLGPDDGRRSRADVFLSEYRRRFDLARFRDEVRRRSRWSRLGPVLRRARAGDYRRYLRTLASPAKDAFL